MASGYTRYYSQQGAGLSDIGRLHHQPIHYQRGAGIGGFFTTLYKYLSPLAASGLSLLKDQAVRSGKEILNDIGTKPLKEILKNRGREAVNDLTVRGIEKLKKTVSGGQKGSGYIKRRSYMDRAIVAKAITTRRRRRRRQHHTKKTKTIRRRTKIKQIGGRRRRRRGTTTRKRTKRSRTLDIFN